MLFVIEDARLVLMGGERVADLSADAIASPKLHHRRTNPLHTQQVARFSPVRPSVTLLQNDNGLGYLKKCTFALYYLSLIDKHKY